MPTLRIKPGKRMAGSPPPGWDMRFRPGARLVDPNRPTASAVDSGAVKLTDKLAPAFEARPEPVGSLWRSAVQAPNLEGVTVEWGTPEDFIENTGVDWFQYTVSRVVVDDEPAGEIRVLKNGRKESTISVCYDDQMSFVPGLSVEWIAWRWKRTRKSSVHEAIRGTYRRALEGQLTFDGWCDMVDALTGERKRLRESSAPDPEKTATTVVVREVAREVPPQEPILREHVTAGGHRRIIACNANPDVDRYFDE